MKKPALSQHFLRDPEIATHIVDLAGIRPGDRVLEIGPGHGELSELIIQRGARLTAIEIDTELAELLRCSFADAEIIAGDATKVEWPPCDIIISNMPYHVTTPLIMRVLDHDYKYAVLTLQEEYAERMVAPPGCKRYSRLSVCVYCKAACRILGRIPSTAFSPPPEVTSAIVGLRPRGLPFDVSDKDLYFNLVRILFSHRRKMIGTILRHRFNLPKGIHIPFEKERVEELSPEEIAKICDAISRAMKNEVPV